MLVFTEFQVQTFDHDGNGLLRASILQPLFMYADNPNVVSNVHGAG